MAKDFAFECDCGKSVIMYDGYKESAFTEWDLEEFTSEIAFLGIPVGSGMCSDCDLRYN